MNLVIKNHFFNLFSFWKRVKNVRMFLISGIFLFLFAIIFLVVAPVNAANCEAYIKLITRDGRGEMVKNMKWQAWKQMNDADGNPMGERRILVSNTGEAAWSSVKLSFDQEVGLETYCLKIYDVNENVGEFWHYNVIVHCNETVTVEKRLSNLKVILRDKNGEALKQRKFELYSQKIDIDNNPIIDKTISTSLNTTDAGVKKIYLTPGKYIVKIPAIDNKFSYTQYNLIVSESEESIFDYKLSNVSVSIRDGEGNLQKDTGFDVYKHKTDVDGNFILGEHVGRYNTGDTGIGGIFLPTDTYVFRFDGSGGQYYYLWNQKIDELKSHRIDYRLSNVNIIIRDGNGELIPNSNFDVYVQNTDVDGKFILGEHVGRYNTGDTGAKGIFLPTGTYVVRYDGSGKEFYYLWNQKIDGSKTFNISYELATLKVVITGVADELLKDIKVEVFKQAYDEEHKVILGSAVVNANTGDGGSAVFYLPAGKYALGITGPDAKKYYVWEKEIKESDYTKVLYKLSAFNIIVKNGKSELVTDVDVEIYMQNYDAEGKVILGQKVVSKSTGQTGKVIFYYPEGEYAIKINNPSNIKTFDYYFWQKKINEQRITDLNLFLSTIRIVAKGATGKLIKNVSVKVATQKLDYEGKPVVDKILKETNTGILGYVDFYLPGDIYALVTGAEELFNVKVRDLLMTLVEINKSEEEELKFGQVEEPEPIGLRADGSLVRTIADGRIYVLENGFKRHITNPTIFNTLGYNWEKIIIISEIEMASYPEGDPLGYTDINRPNGTLVKGMNSPAVYLIEDGKIRPFLSASVFETLGYDWTKIVIITEEELSTYEFGAVVTFTQVGDGSLVKSLNHPAVYLIDNNKKRPILNGRVFSVRGYHWLDIMVISDDELESYEQGEILGFDLTDFDKDGLSVNEEESYGTNPNLDDSDGDGFLDGEEINNGYNPLGEGELI